MASRRPAATAATPADTPAAEWFRFDGPYPVVLTARALEVAPGDVVHWPAGAPDAANWSPADAPTPDPAADDGATSEES